MRTLLTAILGLSLAACTVGGVGDDGADDGADDGGDDAPPPPVPALAVSVTSESPLTDVELGTELLFTIDLMGSGTFGGPVNLAATGVPASWVTEITPAQPITVPVDGTATATLKVTIPSNGEGIPSTIAIAYASTLGNSAAPAGSVTVLNQYTEIVGVAGTACSYPMQFGQPLAVNNMRPLRVGTLYRIRNGGTIPMRIHVEDGVSGFAHQPNAMAPNGLYENVVTSTGIAEWYCHQDPGTATDAGPHPYIEVQ